MFQFHVIQNSLQPFHFHIKMYLLLLTRPWKKGPFLKLIIVKLEYNSAINRLRVHKGNCFSDTQILPNTYKIFHKYSFSRYKQKSNKGLPEGLNYLLRHSGSLCSRLIILKLLLQRMNNSTRPSTPNTVMYDEDLKPNRKMSAGMGYPRPPSGNSLAPPPSTYKSPYPGMPCTKKRISNQFKSNRVLTIFR